MSTTYDNIVPYDNITVGVLSSMVLFFSAIVIVKFCKFNKVWILVALIARWLAGLTEYFLFRLPDSGGDVRNYLNKSYFFFSNPDINFFEVIKEYSGDVYPFLTSRIFLVIDFSVLTIISVNAFIGFLCIIIILNFIGENFGFKNKNLWIGLLVLHPLLILYSSIPLRQSVLIFLFLLSSIYIYKYFKTVRERYFIYSFFAGALYTLIHGAGLIIIVVLSLIYLINFLFSRKINYFSFFLASVPLPIFLFFFLNGDITVSKVGSIDLMISPEYWDRFGVQRFTGSASYPLDLIATQPSDYWYIVPLKYLRFFFSPYPLDVKNIEHILGLVDAVIYMLIWFNIFRQRRNLGADKGLVVVLFLVLVVSFAYSFGVANFGTAIRHRLVFFLPLFFILLATKSMRAIR